MKESANGGNHTLAHPYYQQDYLYEEERGNEGNQTGGVSIGNTIEHVDNALSVSSTIIFSIVFLIQVLT